MNSEAVSLECHACVWHGAHKSRLILAQNVSVSHQLPLSLPWCVPRHKALGCAPVMHRGIAQIPLTTVQL